ncbi:MAG: hypothetical protein J07HQW1_01859 [Haloquadratum walsbyi J07HQW1]|uniref:Uncharacterized protein n=1 Tax=Haloquadratum walsbyi J07HQW1 TaxID=1238424 RepID=U1N5E0_9EURY|nr:MAG: hypothetical protein J07HQW1_01859 [Haloquadratum walsbyi J07HQW1]
MIAVTVCTVCKVGIAVEFSTGATLFTTQIARRSITRLADFTVTSTGW